MEVGQEQVFPCPPGNSWLSELVDIPVLWGGRAQEVCPLPTGAMVHQGNFPAWREAGQAPTLPNLFTAQLHPQLSRLGSRKGLLIQAGAQNPSCGPPVIASSVKGGCCEPHCHGGLTQPPLLASCGMLGMGLMAVGLRSHPSAASWQYAGCQVLKIARSGLWAGVGLSQSPAQMWPRWCPVGVQAQAGGVRAHPPAYLLLDITWPGYPHTLITGPQDSHQPLPRRAGHAHVWLIEDSGHSPEWQDFSQSRDNFHNEGVIARSFFQSLSSLTIWDPGPDLVLASHSCWWKSRQMLRPTPLRVPCYFQQSFLEAPAVLSVCPSHPEPRHGFLLPTHKRGDPGAAAGPDDCALWLSP